MSDPPRKAAKPAPRIGLSALEWRLYLTTAFAGIYTAVGLALAPRAEPPTAAPAIADVADVAAPPPARVVWLDELPASLRPTVSLPAGWSPASRTAAAPATTLARAPAPRVAPRARPVRIRTRSS